jgi:hypothetical protein
MSNELNDICKELLKEELKNELIEILMGKLPEKVKETYKINSKNAKITKIKTMRRYINN